MPWHCEETPKFSHLTLGTSEEKSDIGCVQGAGKVFSVLLILSHLQPVPQSSFVVIRSWHTFLCHKHR